MPSPLSRVLASIISRGHCLALLDAIQPGEYGCISCGWCGPAGDVTPAKRSRMGLCPACGLDLYDNGYLDGPPSKPAG